VSFAVGRFKTAELLVGEVQRIEEFLWDWDWCDWWWRGRIRTRT